MELINAQTISIVLFFFAVLFTSFYLYSYRKSSDSWNEGDLTDEERQVVNLVQQNGGLISQKEISKSLEWSDARTSRVCSSLLEKEVINKNRTETGNTITSVENKS